LIGADQFADHFAVIVESCRDQRTLIQAATCPE
jgi:hypothetical protein